MVPSKRTWQPLPDVQNVSFADVSNFHLMMSSIRFECLLNSIPFPPISSHFIPSDFHLISFRCILSRSVSSYSYHSSMHFILWIEFHSVLFDPFPYTRYKKLLHHVWWNMQLKTIMIRNISTGTAGTGMLDTLRYSMSDLKKSPPWFDDLSLSTRTTGWTMRICRFAHGHKTAATLEVHLRLRWWYEEHVEMCGIHSLVSLLRGDPTCVNKSQWMVQNKIHICL
jgi:hypothetical protein